jgi:hypothetical protein
MTDGGEAKLMPSSHVALTRMTLNALYHEGAPIRQVARRVMGPKESDERCAEKGKNLEGLPKT